MNRKKIFDISRVRKQGDALEFLDMLNKVEAKPVLYSKGKRSSNFFTEDSRLYISPREQELLRKGVRLDRTSGKWDCLSSRVINGYIRHRRRKSDMLLEALERRYDLMQNATDDAWQNFIGQFSMVRLWNASIVGSILLGMVMMTFVYRYLGQGASADVAIQQASPTVKTEQIMEPDTSGDAESFAKEVMAIQKNNDQKTLEKEIRQMVKGYPIEEQVPYIAKLDRTVAAFYVAIARKESGWGVHVPVLKGQDCYNYVGYRGKRKLMGSGGHTCFNSPQDAVQTVAKRIATLVEEQGKDTPREMVKTWKCGGNCAATGGQAAADKWAVDVNEIFNKFKMKSD